MFVSFVNCYVLLRVIKSFFCTSVGFILHVVTHRNFVLKPVSHLKSGPNLYEIRPNIFQTLRNILKYSYKDL